MYKIKIFPSLKNDISFFINKIKENKLSGCPHYLHNGEYNLLNNTSHKILDIYNIGEDMWGIVEFLENKNGLKMKALVDVSKDIYLKEFFLSKDNLALNIYIKI